MCSFENLLKKKVALPYVTLRQEQEQEQGQESDYNRPWKGFFLGAM
jgi:hypothetical protein